jgi:hypothetical protein
MLVLVPCSWFAALWVGEAAATDDCSGKSVAERTTVSPRVHTYNLAVALTSTAGVRMCEEGHGRACANRHPRIQVIYTDLYRGTVGRGRASLRATVRAG